jgi:hypothetical protein
MKRRTTTVLALALFAALSISGGSGSTTSAVGGNPHANGGGTTVEGGEKSTFVFNAVQQIDGSVVGHLTYHLRFADVTIHMQNDCLNFTSSNTAVISGTVTMVTGSTSFVPGAHGVFVVRDNGEGNNANPDLISDVFIDPNPLSTINCQNVTTLTPYLPIDGNIDVKP